MLSGTLKVPTQLCPIRVGFVVYAVQLDIVLAVGVTVPTVEFVV